MGARPIARKLGMIEHGDEVPRSLVDTVTPLTLMQCSSYLAGVEEGARQGM